MDVKNLKDIDDKIGNAFKPNKEIAINQLEEIISKMPIEIIIFIAVMTVLSAVFTWYVTRH